MMRRFDRRRSVHDDGRRFDRRPCHRSSSHYMAGPLPDKAADQGFCSSRLESTVVSSLRLVSSFRLLSVGELGKTAPPEASPKAASESSTEPLGEVLVRFSAAVEVFLDLFE